MQGFLPVPDRVAFTVFGIDIMWYGIMLTLGTLVGGTVLYQRAPKYGLTKDNSLDLMIYSVPVGVIGARLYYVAFEWDYYGKHLKEILNTRGGGLAIHGGIIFGLGMALLLIHKWKGQPLKIMDLAAPGFAIGQCIGRWGNYFNSEAHGGPTDLPWAILCDGELVHPTFLYESIWCLIIFLVLMYVERSGKRSYDGQLFIIYAMMYSFERFFVEQLRTDSLYIGGLRQACIISACTFFLCLIVRFPLKKRGIKPLAVQIEEDEPSES